MPPLAAANNTTVNLKQSQIGAVWRGLALGGGMWLAAACSAEGEPELGIPLTRNRSTSTQPRATTSEHVAHGLADSGAPELAASTQQPAPNPVSSATEQTVVPAPSLGNGAGLGENPPETEPSQVPAPDATTPSSATSTEPPETQPSAAMSSAGALASDTPPAAPSGGFFGGFGAGTDDAPEPEEPPLGEGGAGGEQGSGEAGSGEAGAPTTGGAGGVAGNPGGSFGGEPGDECNALAVGINSGAIGTQAVCFVVNGPLQGWQVSNLTSRTLTVNGATVVAPALPAAPDGTYTFEFSAGDPEYTAFSTW